MRVQIKTNGPVKDPDIKALYMLDAAVKMSTPRILKANLKFILDKHKIQIL